MLVNGGEHVCSPVLNFSGQPLSGRLHPSGDQGRWLARMAWISAFAIPRFDGIASWGAVVAHMRPLTEAKPAAEKYVVALVLQKSLNGSMQRVPMTLVVNENLALNAPSGASANTLALRIADSMGLLSGPKTKHFNAKVPPQLFEAAARRIGTNSPAAVISAALASLATEDDLGPWLAQHWGELADVPPDLLDQIDL